MTRVSVRAATTGKDRRRFFDFPYRHYRDAPYWVPPLRADQKKALDPKKNPFFDHGRVELFLAEDEKGTTVGRIAAIINGSHLEKYGDGVGYFGFFETIEDYGVAEALLDAACGWLKENGLTGVRGPTNPTINDTAGLLVEGFDRRPFILMPYNPPYYIEYLERYGFDRAMTMWALYVHAAYINHERMRRGAELVLRRYPEVSVRPMHMKTFWEDAHTARRIYNAAWSDNWGSVPMTEREFEHLAKDLKQIIEPDMVYFVEVDGEAVAFSVTIPNLNRALVHVKDGRLLPLGLPKLLAYAKMGGMYEARMPLMGVLPEYHGRGFDALLIDASIRAGRPKGYEASELSWVLDVNAPLINSLEKLGAVRDKKYVMVQKHL
jgi:GNAT superfamily N-acetyltransferase